VAEGLQSPEASQALAVPIVDQLLVENPDVPPLARQAAVEIVAWLLQRPVFCCPLLGFGSLCAFFIRRWRINRCKAALIKCHCWKPIHNCQIISSKIKSRTRVSIILACLPLKLMIVTLDLLIPELSVLIWNTPGNILTDNRTTKTTGPRPNCGPRYAGCGSFK
jgi:hypothetical protein